MIIFIDEDKYKEPHLKLKKILEFKKKSIFGQVKCRVNTVVPRKIMRHD